MVNHCCVKGCGRSSKLSAHLNFYTIPKEKARGIKWLTAAGREDLIKKSAWTSTYRFCSRHFDIKEMKGRYLLPDAMPTLFLPNESSDNDEELIPHHDIVCDNCKNTILGFRYKCVTCKDYDLCPKCEMLETHGHHYMLRIPRPLKFKIADDLIKKWRSFFKSEHVNPDCTFEDTDTSGCSSDDEPISRHLERINDGGDLDDDVKVMIRNEVSRVLALKDRPDDKKKRKKRKKGDSLLYAALVKSSKKPRVVVEEAPQPSASAADEARPLPAPEVAFADVNAYKEQLDIKNEAPSAPTEGEDTDFVQPLMHVRLSDDLTELMIEMTNRDVIDKTIYNTIS